MKRVLLALWAVAATHLLVISTSHAQPGTVDFSFNAGYGVDFTAYGVGMQSSGKWVIGGAFGTPASGVARLNADGSPDATFNTGTGVSPGFGYTPGLSSVYALAVQPDDKVIIGGTFNTYNGIGRTNIARLNADGTLDLTFDPGQGIGTISPKVLALCLQPDGKVLVGGNFSSVNGTNRIGIARLNANGSLDSSFDPSPGVGGLNFTVYAVALQPDGRVLVGGIYQSIHGTNINSIARLNADGSFDSSFDPGAGVNGTVMAIAVQTNTQQIVIGGSFNRVNNTNRTDIARLNADGSLDLSFATSANGAVNAVLPLSNGTLLLGGNFTVVNNTNHSRIARLRSDGNVDPGFNPGTGPNSAVEALALLPNGQALLAGDFTLVSGVQRNYAARLDTDGSLDAGFNTGGTPYAVVNCVLRQPDGRLLIGGNFTNVTQSARSRIARLHADGSLDGSFDPGAGPGLATANVEALALQSNGQVLVGGLFTTVDGLTQNALARLNADGSLDDGYNPVLTGSYVDALAVQAGDQLLIGGSFSKVNGTARGNFARLNSNGSLDTGFAATGAGAKGVVRAIVVLTNGQVVIGGDFTAYNGTNLGCIARVNADGSLDTTFNSGGGASQGSPTQIYALALQPDGKLLIGGRFEVYGGVAAENLARLNADGSADTNFHTGSLDGGNVAIHAVAPQPDGKVLIGGEFLEVHGIGRSYYARVNSDGSLDTTFNPGAGALCPLYPYVYSIVRQPDGEVVLGGGFTSINHSPAWYVARVHGDAPLFGSSTPAGGGVTLQWSAITGRTYRVQYKPDISSVSWSDLPPDVIASGSLASTTDPAPAAHHFYRVVLLP
ncbi:MAG TPA: delta-60 repeat domain-containing protein [Candidatus Acidoferrum sp.]|nr:delta-60 repeat domain-containing protein [Candidatus Acidoferrum sp.]